MPASTRVILPLALLFLVSTAHAQHITAHPAHAHNSAITANNAAALPLTHVSLYKNGVGFFEHAGRVSGNASIALDFTSSQLDDVLQSLTAIDLNGGLISGADYNSTTPLDQQLQNLALGLPANTTFSGLFDALRGARVEIHGSGVPFTGRIVDIETHKTASTESTSPARDSAAMLEGRFLTVASDTGPDTGTVRIFEITPALSVRLLDTSAHTDLTEYLQLLDANRSRGLRRLTLLDRAPAHATGPRELRVSYLSEVPIWKSTYRILLTTANPGASSPTNPGGPFMAQPYRDMGGVNSATTATVQGWSVVDNTTGADWINVHLSLIAGAPDSFIQPISQPIYSRRPEIPIAEQAQLTPQTHDSAIEMRKEEGPAAAPQNLPLIGRSIGYGSGSGIGAASESVTVAGTPGGVFGGIAGGYGIGPGSGGNIGGGVFHLNGAPITYEDAASASIAPQAQTAGFDDFFAYNLTDPVTILKNQSALVPILQAKLPADSVTLVSYANGRTSQPLRALWITNTSGLTLDRGSFTLIEDGSFAGEGLLDPIHPAEKRLLSYAADQAVHASAEDEKSSSRVTLIRASRGVLTIHHAELHEVTLVLHNAAPTPRAVVSEVPVVNGWKLDSLTDPSSTDPKPIETTATVYRFRNSLAPDETARLHVGATRASYTTYFLTNSNDNQLQLILNETNHNPALEAALQPILDARRRLADAQTAVDQANFQIAQLRSDEDRQRANIAALQHADKRSRDRFVAELNHTEDALHATQADLAARISARDAAQTDLANRIDSLQLDQHL